MASIISRSAENSFIFLLGVLQFCKFFMGSEVKFCPLLSGSSACLLVLYERACPLWYPVLLQPVLIIRQGGRDKREID